MSILLQWFDYTTLIVTVGVMLTSINTGIISVYFVLRKQSLLGDVLSHTALPGIIGVFLLTTKREMSFLLIGAFITCIIGVWMIYKIVSTKKLKTDNAFALVLSLFFGLSVLFLSFAQKQPQQSQAGIQSFFFGQASTIVFNDLIVISCIFIALSIFVIIFWKELKMFVFDKEYMLSCGFKTYWLEGALLVLSILIIVVGLKIVGVILMASMVIAPAAAARQWTSSFFLMVCISIFISLICSTGGVALSSVYEKIPTGPVIIVLLSTAAGLSILFAPKKGVLKTWVELQNKKKELQIMVVLHNLYALSQQHDNPFHLHSEKVLQSMTGFFTISYELSILENLGLVQKNGDLQWSITQRGIDRVREYQKQIYESTG